MTISYQRTLALRLFFGAMLSALAGQTRAAEPAQSPFVRLSPRDARYFELSNGKPYLPIGFNLVPGPQPQEIQRTVETMARNGINYCRIWIDQTPWTIETRSGQYDPEKAKNLDQFLALCRQRGIYVKMCIEYFRDIPPQSNRWSDKPMHHTANGGPFKDMNDFLTSAAAHAQFKRKLAWYANRYGDEPAVFAWELWNEMNAVRGDWRDWTRLMLPELHRLFPKNLAVQSLGSFDTAGVRGSYRELCLIKDNDIAQVHRYLDLGGQLEICHAPVDLLAADAVAELRAFNAGKPIILTETGAVKPKHTGASELYAKDPDGTLLHDMLFAPFFAGAAGTGHVWWWRQAIEQPNLWHHYARFARAVEGVDPPAEGFVPMQPSHPRLRIYALQGKRTYLAWCRDSANTWQSELVDGRPPETLKGQTLDLTDCGLDLQTAQIRLYNPWTDQWTPAQANQNRLPLPDFTRSLVVRIETPPK
jgi:hypothetical protein